MIAREFSKPLSKILFTLHRNDINICSLVTCTCEELCSTLHHSSPTLHPENLWIENRRPKGKPNLWDFLQRPNRSIYRLVLCAIRRWRVVKSGEEWCVTLHLSQPQCLSGFQPIWWRVKSKKKSGAFIKKTPDVSFCAWQWQIIALVRGNVVP